MSSTYLETNSESGYKTAMPADRLLRAYLIEAKFETLRMLRAPAFAIPFLLLPVTIYLLLAAVIFGEALRSDANAAMLFFVGLSVFGMMGPGLFGFAGTVAIEREQGLLKLRRALPMPPAAYLLAKMLMAMMFNLIIMVTMIVAALSVGRIRLTALEILSVIVINALGAIPFCAIGLFIGTLVSGSSAPGFVNIIYFPMMWLSGIFIPLPKLLQTIAPIWPAYHLMQLMRQAAGAQSAGSLILHVGVLSGLTVVLTLLGARRLQRES